ncbi:MAG: DNA internalization-related competence protein ComEC/Rec2 [Pseudomonadaceae bacterium]|nr:DNA internalization-related competence protein ComEC/Rec2 [Pseudomonadaceae bacterium]
MQPKPFQRSRHGVFLRQILLTIAAGIVVAAWLPATQWLLPALLVSVSLLPIALVCARLAQAPWTILWAHIGALIALFAAATLYGTLVGGAQLESRIPPCVVDASAQAPLRIVADVIEPVRQRLGRVRLRVETTQPMQLQGCSIPSGRILELNWFDPPQVRLGDRLSLSVALRPPRGLLNPGAFDYERWLFAEKVDGLGSVRAGRVVARAQGLLISVRSQAREAVLTYPLLHPGALLALSIGDAGLVRNEHWQRFRETGTIHLMVISGLHIGIAFLLLHGALRIVVAGLQLVRVDCRCGPAIGVLVAWLATGGLVALTGFSEPALRAWLMLAGFLLVRAVHREPAGLLILLEVFVLVVVALPLSVLSQGLWLSFYAVAVLLLLANRLPGSRLLQLLLLQGLMAIAMAPAIALFNGELVLVAALANALVAPIASFVIVPLSMLSVFLATLDWPGAGWLLTLADVCVHVLYRLLDYSNALAPIAIGRGDSSRLLLAAVGVFLLLLPLPWSARALGSLAAALMLVPASTDIPPGEFRLQVLDVGQGSAAIIDTSDHRIIVDAGYRSPGGFDMGAAVVVPAFLATGPRQLDLFVISHGDVDHSGGAGAVIDRLAPATTLAGAGVEGAFARCRSGWQWTRDGVVVSMAAANLNASNDNDGSCVIRVANQRRAVLLPGDISAVEEYRLALTQPEPVDVLVAAHHGSRSSSSARFLQALQPTTAIVSAGYANRFGHPHEDVLERFAERGISVLRTDEGGMVTWESLGLQASEQRCCYQPYWRTVSSR